MENSKISTSSLVFFITSRLYIQLPIRIHTDIQTEFFSSLLFPSPSYSPSCQTTVSASPFTPPCHWCFLCLQHPPLLQPLVVTWPGSPAYPLTHSVDLGSSLCWPLPYCSVISLATRRTVCHSQLFPLSTIQTLARGSSEWILLSKLIFQGLPFRQSFVHVFFLSWWFSSAIRRVLLIYADSLGVFHLPFLLYSHLLEYYYKLLWGLPFK